VTEGAISDKEREVLERMLDELEAVALKIRDRLDAWEKDRHLARESVSLRRG